MQLPASVELGNRITAQEAAQRFGLGSYARLIPAIKAGIVRGYRIEVGRRCIYLVDPAELAEDLANLPMCAYCGEKPALAPSGVCSGPHARALETKGKHWRTREAIEKTAAAKRGKPRPDVRERVAAMHGDPHQRYPWHLAILEGRGRKAASIPARRIRDAKNRVNGLKGHRDAVPVSDEARREIWRLKDLGYGRRTIPEFKTVDYSEDVVRRVLHEPRPG